MIAAGIVRVIAVAEAKPLTLFYSEVDILWRTNMFNVALEDLYAMIGQLEQAVHSHEDWFDALNRTMLCRLPYDEYDLDPQAHRHCPFGEWFYGNTHPAFRAHPAMRAIAKEHEQMHSAAASLLAHATSSSGVIPAEYDSFMGALQRFRLEITTLRDELQGVFYTLDHLTGAHTRIGMLTYLREQMELVHRGAQSVTVAMFDFDLFKRINDTYGHPTGDRVLAAVAKFVTESIRPYDRFFRYGGEEFLLCMQHTDMEAAMLIVERLRQGVADLVIDNAGTAPLSVTVSIGVAAMAAGQAVEDTISGADHALYAAKAAGRNRTERWSPAT